jgi:hypothetical protein
MYDRTRVSGKIRTLSGQGFFCSLWKIRRIFETWSWFSQDVDAMHGITERHFTLTEIFRRVRLMQNYYVSTTKNRFNLVLIQMKTRDFFNCRISDKCFDSDANRHTKVTQPLYAQKHLLTITAKLNINRSFTATKLSREGNGISQYNV